MRYKAPIDLNK